MIEEDPGQLKRTRSTTGERFYPSCLGGVMAGIKQIDPQFLSQSKCVMRTLAGNKSIYSFSFCLR